MNHPFSLIPHHHIEKAAGGAVGRFGDKTLSSVYQPIVSPALLRIVGVEALLRVQGPAGTVTPTDFFAALEGENIAEGCRLARAIHVLNAPPMPQGNEWLFLNVHPEAIRRRQLSVAQVVSEIGALGVPPSRIVLEVVEGAGLTDDEFSDFVAEYRAAGFRVAIDDFGAGVSNYDRVLAVQPDIIKLDRSLIVNAAASSRARRLFPHVVALLREAGSLVVVEGIETEEQAQIAIDADAELLQGWYFAQASPGVPDAAACRRKVESVLVEPKGASYRKRGDAERFRGRFLDSWTAFRDGKPIELVAQDIEDEHVTRLYVIDSRGFQVGDTALTRNAIRGAPHPLANATGACWARRHYFRQAMEQPGRIQLTRPYLSLTEQRLCVTFSCATSHKAYGQCVVCMDVLVDP